MGGTASPGLAQVRGADPRQTRQVFVEDTRLFGPSTAPRTYYRLGIDARALQAPTAALTQIACIESRTIRNDRAATMKRSPVPAICTRAVRRDRDKALGNMLPDIVHLDRSLQTMPKASSIHVTVCVAPGLEVLAGELLDALQREAGAGFQVALGGLASNPERADLVVQVVDPDGLPEALMQLAGLRSRHPGCCSLGVLRGLNHEQLNALLAAGASDFLSAGAVADEFVARVRRLLGMIVPAGAAAPTALPGLPDLVGQSAVFTAQVARLPVLARYDVGVLLLGETGTGKEVFAQSAHYLSPRAGQPWVAVNCGAIPVELIEDELFGHVRGAYTHAHAPRAGLIREAEGGTLFLDEIDALPYGAQVKLLRFLQDKQYRPVGSSTIAQADVRVYAASNRPLAELAAQGSFRQDLFFRLNLITLHLPPLRERLEDIGPLALHFLSGAARQWRKPVATLTHAALNKLIAHRWPGNVRELKNVMERATLLSAGGPLLAADIDLDGAEPAADAAPCGESLRAAKGRLVESFERTYIEQLLASSGGNVTHAAQAAKKNRRAFFELMRKYQIEPKRFRSDVDKR